jgi:pimeloyl-ACP methyl ester carboxylesterase
VDSVVSDIDQAGLDSVVIAGHSMAGLVMPGVMTKLGPARVAEATFVTAFVPPQGAAMADTMGGPATPLVRWGARLGRPYKLPIAARLLFCNGMTRAQRQFAMSRLYRESMTILAEPVDRSEVPTWVMTLNDRTLSEKQQRASIDALGGVDAIYPIDTCHDVMISEPGRLAQILVERCRARTDD